MRYVAFLAGVLLLAACSMGGAPPPPAEVSRPIKASQGGSVEHPGGARLVIPPGALDRDTVIRIRDHGVAPADRWVPAVPASRRFGLDLGGARLLKPVDLWLRYPDRLGHAGPVRTDHLLVLTRDAEGNPWLRPVAEPRLEGGQRWIRRRIANLPVGTKALGNPARDYGYGLVYVAPLLGLATTVLDVPYYWQDNLPWCAPTSMAMVANYHQGGIGGLVSNTFLAGRHRQDAGQGAWPHRILADAGVAADGYSYYRWDADAIPAGAFTSYVKQMLNGFNLADVFGASFQVLGVTVNIEDRWVPPRPLELASTTTNHAFVAVGADDSGIWLHDSSGAFTGSPGIALNFTWTRFRQVAIDTTRSDELYTLGLNADPRPAAERRGSIVLFEGQAGDSSLVWKNAQDYPVASYRWDGDPYPHGYYWALLAGAEPVDDEFGIAFNRVNGVLVGKFAYRLRVANVSNASRDFHLVARVVDSAGHELVRSEQTLFGLAGRSWGDVANLAVGALPVSITSPGTYWIEFWLYQSGTLQDVKRVGFRVR